ncbi:aminotransferase class V-fold PLP-dependent enzyme [Catalinimonas niigatensis]|uniref:aminotransferase class V-fold PLP-dependent enzyme n=1 Tax=Catalinimonas niigatensis TaxID=1397264 RepID=UPI0026653377|nr:aminotransferase class V-fold PLP-dependent enzyme [Catalinimonas niigatensis]WPP49680.1 aminotransferase class V-fold PLP-dependent enzyme [Catalinimonas niigatensis]
MISFYPGPSKVYAEVPAYVKEAYAQGILSTNHRSNEFVEISAYTISLLKAKLHIPEEYKVFYTSSATECWEIISQSLVKEESFHIYNGAFGEKWLQYAQKLQPGARHTAFELNETLLTEEIQVPATAELIALTHNETSNGTALTQEQIGSIKRIHPDKLVAVDATSSMAGVELEFSFADVWYASVQKCFGLPAGLALLVCSPQALEKAATVNERKHYNSLLYMQEMMEKWQTTYTPNVLNIYLLMRVMEMRPTIEHTEKLLLRRYQKWMDTFEDLTYADLLVKNETVRSKTVIPFQADKAVIDQLRTESKKAGLVLGNGYGSWKESSLRIANFPAIEDWEIEKLTDFLKSFSV